MKKINIYLLYFIIVVFCIIVFIIIKLTSTDNYIKNNNLDYNNRICTSLLPYEHRESSKHNLSAVSVNKWEWKPKIINGRPVFPTLKVKFLNKPSDFGLFSRSYKEGEKDDTGNIIIWDPLEEKFHKNKTEIREAIKQIINERYNAILGINFEFVPDDYDNEETHIRIKFDPTRTSSASLVGTSCFLEDVNKPTMFFAWFDVGTVLHEFGHALGLDHEHQSPLSTIRWNEREVFKYYNARTAAEKEIIRKQVLSKLEPDKVTTSKEFDYNSIMLYFFPATLTDDNKGTTQNQRLSSEDVIYLNKLYPKDDMDNTKLSDWYYSIYGKILYKT
jgi:hypothetical protein